MIEREIKGRSRKRQRKSGIWILCLKTHNEPVHLPAFAATFHRAAQAIEHTLALSRCVDSTLTIASTPPALPTSTLLSATKHEKMMINRTRLEQ